MYSSLFSDPTLPPMPAMPQAQLTPGLMGGNLSQVQPAATPMPINMPAASASALPPVSAPPQSRLSKLHEGLLNFMGLAQPQGYEGLLSPDEIKQARPSFLQALIGGPNAPSSSQMYRDNLDGLVQHRMLAMQLGQQQDSLQLAHQQRQLRQQVLSQFPPLSPNATPQQQAQYLMRMYESLAQNGLTDDAAKLGEVLKSMGDVLNGPKPVPPQDLKVTNLGDHTVWTNPVTGQVVKTEANGKAPRSASEVDAQTNYQAGQANKILDDYSRDTKDFHQVMGGWDVLQGATKDPSLATPFAVTDAYARITNPGALVRPTTLDMIHDMGSVGQRMQKWWAQNAQGSLPPDILRDFQKTLYNIVKEHKKQYDQIRAKTILRGKQAGVSIEPLLQDYQLDDPTAAATAATSTSANKVRSLMKR